MASVKCTRPDWPVPGFIWDLRTRTSWRRKLLRRVAGILRVLLYFLNGFVFKLFVWIAAVEDLLTISDDQ